MEYRSERKAMIEPEAKLIDVEARQAKVAQILNGSDKLGEQLKASVALMDKLEGDELIDYLAERPQAKPPRKKRSDAGKPKQKAPAIAQQPGFLSAMQVLRLRDLIDTRETRRIELEMAKDHLANREGALDAADNELDDFLNELQGKKTG